MGAMPKGVYERSEEQKERARSQAGKATEASAAYWRGRARSEEQKRAHSETMRGRTASNKGVPMPWWQKEAQKTHGHASGGKLSPTYLSWRSMVYRCTKPNVSNYKYYGGRGITVCDRWRDFANFLADMGERPEGLQLGRIDNDGNYEPGNVMWQSKSENIADRNRRAAKPR